MLSTKNCAHCGLQGLCIRKIPLFSSLSNDELVKILPLIQHYAYNKGDIILHDKEPINTLIMINQGKVKASKYSSEGREQIIHVFNETEFFGEQFLTETQYSDYTIEALSEVHICVLSKNHFNQIVIDHPDIAMNLISELYKRMRKLESTIYHLNIRDVDTRVNALLVSYAIEHGKATQQGIVIDLPLSREQMANYLGIARETMSRKLTQLENDSLIISINNRKILIKNLELLQQTLDI